MMKDKRVWAGAAVLIAAAFWFYIKPNFFDSSPPPAYTDEQIAQAPRPTITLDEKVFNLKAPPNAPNYVKASIALEFADPDHKYIALKGAAISTADETFKTEHAADIPRIADAITSVLGAKSVDDVSTTAGREELKGELVAAINQQLTGDQVEGVFFVSFITQ